MKRQYSYHTLLSFIFIGCIAIAATAQSTDQNYVRTRTFTNEVGTTYLDEIQYFDGLGRPVQTVQKNITPSGKDLVTLQEYDGADREIRKWLPALSENNGSYVDPESVKSSAENLNRDTNPYSIANYDASPENRIVESFGPGYDWHTHGKSVKTRFLSNKTTDSKLTCRKLKAVGTILFCEGYYASNKLFINESKDEDDNVSYEFKNTNGQVLLARQINKVNGVDENHDTYYVYDDYENLCFVLPPMASESITGNGSWNESTAFLKDYAYIYQYDELRHCIKKKIPGCDWILYIYDKADHLIFTQDGVSRDVAWKFTIPDLLGRTVLTGICYNLINPETYRDKYIYAEFGSTFLNNLYFYKYKIYNFVPNDQYSLLVNYYDGYGFDEPTLAYKNQSGYDSRYNSSSYAAKGLLTGTKRELIETQYSKKCLNASYYYDSHGRVIQANSTNHRGGKDSEYLRYDFVGNPLAKYHEQTICDDTNPSLSSSLTEEYLYSYDNARRKKETKHRINSGNYATISNLVYDERGRLGGEYLFGQKSLGVGYAYNLRSWILDIQGPSFNETLFYNYYYYQGKPCFNGNISEIHWTSWGPSRRFTFNYDNLSRLTSTLYWLGASEYHDFDESFTYDKNGNITKLVRMGSQSIEQHQIVDDLTITYKGNQIDRIVDSGSDMLSSTSYDYKDYLKSTSPFVYTLNGSLRYDRCKGLIFDYDKRTGFLNRISIRAVDGYVKYLYSADGEKLKVSYRYNPERSLNPLENIGAPKGELTNSSMDYVKNVIFENSSLTPKKILIENGYYEYNSSGSGKYYFYVKDHQGNVRVVVDQLGTAIQYNQYYPFGLPFAEGYGQEKQPYKYNGKEFDTMLGLNMYDYHARFYDPALQRFITIDPLCEKYYSISPYAYCLNNPVKYVDQDGKQVVMPFPFPPLPVIITGTNNNNLGSSFKLMFEGTVNNINKNMQFATTLASLQVISLQASLSPEFQNQRKRDREGKEALDRNQANVQQSIENNVTGNMPNGDPSPKRNPNGLGGKLLIGGAITRGLMEVTNPNPSKDAHEAHTEKVINKRQESSRSLKVNKMDKKVFEIMEHNWSKK